MKSFTPQNSGGHSKINFVDHNNVLVGWDIQQSCCENADWFFSDTPESLIPKGHLFQPDDLPGYNFDPTYRKTVEGDEFDEGGMTIFRLVSDSGEPDKYLHLFNCQNGYYSHGFTFENPAGNIVEEGSL